MPEIRFITHDGTVHPIDAEIGATLMETAFKNGLSGIEAICGGACACATCHVHIADQSMLDDMEEMEKVMLEFAHEPDDDSRLSCQIRITDAMDGLEVRIPEYQC